MKIIDLRSDTVTLPTQEMRQAMCNAVVGDDVYNEDITVQQLEALAAKITDKEAALFVPSGTMGNQLAIMTHTKRGDEIIAGDSSHIIEHEVGAAAVLAGVTVRTAKTQNGILSSSEVLKLIRSENIHHPDTGLICIENATAMGTVMSLDEMKEIYETAKKANIPVHLDGARLFNAAVVLGVEAAQITAYTDSVMFCLSKGLCAPIGSILAGSREFIEKARRNRKLLGGGMRQVGILAAAGMFALEKMVERLDEDHKNAKLLAEALSSIPGVDVDTSTVQINMVFADISRTGKTETEFVEAMLEKGIKINESKPLRFVTNHDVSRQDIEFTIETIKGIFE
ncbi:MAG: low-specificity L-threonine aldolase [Clostridia bacterium]|nr:low-specificity L-threonine aldolase [Clostridia bacterium]